MPRLRLYDIRTGRLSEAVGILQGDVVGMAILVNAAQKRLVTAREAGDTGWWGSWARTVFNVSRASPTFTLPRTIARVINLDVCRHPIRIQNEFYEFMEFGIGKQPKHNRLCSGMEMYDRGVYPTFVDMPANSFVRVYLTDGNDGGQRALIQGIDANGQRVYTMDGFNQVEGIFMSLQAPFVDCPIPMKQITGIQKDVTVGTVQFFAVDQATAAETAILTMDPGEMVSSYRRYYINGLPHNCCGRGADQQPLQVEGMAKLEFVPVVVDTDYLLIQNEEAIIAECKAVRLGDADDLESKAAARAHHAEAIGLLQGELVHYLGKEQPAVVYAPFGSAHLECLKIGMQ